MVRAIYIPYVAEAAPAPGRLFIKGVINAVPVSAVLWLLIFYALGII